ncbi:hypothetical protein PMIT1342_02642 [Prochlorococcus marinus str. MIT 1342]|uniref:hypothetical protein n=1 Tax=Prochlorococcus TaxID=1218 RepID=UPI0007BC692D|nr:hypothetical protein [Prochlorococcus marinus]KZR80682.1 hypothetical protein PMIT1342_02642 [Prochlorococcus marinus str. MIT 1342]
MKKLFLPFAAISLLTMIPNPVLSGLGSAQGKQTEKFDAWCARKGNDCVVLFKNGKITVDGNDSVPYEDIVGLSKASNWNYKIGGSYWLYTYTVFFMEDGVKKSGTFLFGNGRVANQFEAQIEMVCGVRCRAIGPSITIEEK